MEKSNNVDNNESGLVALANPTLNVTKVAGKKALKTTVKQIVPLAKEGIKQGISEATKYDAEAAIRGIDSAEQIPMNNVDQPEFIRSIANVIARGKTQAGARAGTRKANIGIDNLVVKHLPKPMVKKNKRKATNQPKNLKKKRKNNVGEKEDHPIILHPYNPATVRKLKNVIHCKERLKEAILNVRHSSANHEFISVQDFNRYARRQIMEWIDIPCNCIYKVEWFNTTNHQIAGNLMNKDGIIFTVILPTLVVDKLLSITEKDVDIYLRRDSTNQVDIVALKKNSGNNREKVLSIHNHSKKQDQLARLIEDL